MTAPDDPIVEQLDALLEDYSVPEIVDGLIMLARIYKDQLKNEKNSEWQGWASIEVELTRALTAIGGND